MAIRTTVVGSYPAPPWVIAHPTRGALRDALLVVLKTQELAGIDLVTDGELNRFDPNHPETNGMIDYFVSRMEGIRTRFGLADLRRFRSDAGLAYRSEPAGLVVGPLGPGTLNLPRDFESTRPLTEKPLKFTCTGPHMLSKVLTDSHYGDRGALAMAIAEVLAEQLASIDAPVIQLDEANISGHPEDRDWALPAINRVLESIRGERAVHVCFGNYGGQTVQHGFYRDLLPFLNGLACHHLVLEFARRGYGELEELRDLDPRLRLGLGVVDIKDNAIEPADLIARRLEQAARALGEDRIAYINPDCGLWMLPRGVADAKMKALAAGRDLFEKRA